MQHRHRIGERDVEPEQIHHVCLWFLIAMNAEQESRASQQTMQIGADDDVPVTHDLDSQTAGAQLLDRMLTTGQHPTDEQHVDVGFSDVCGSGAVPGVMQRAEATGHVMERATQTLDDRLVGLLVVPDIHCATEHRDPLLLLGPPCALDPHRFGLHGDVARRE